METKAEKDYLKRKSSVDQKRINYCGIRFIISLFFITLLTMGLFVLALLANVGFDKCVNTILPITWATAFLMFLFWVIRAKFKFSEPLYPPVFVERQDYPWVVLPGFGK